MAKIFINFWNYFVSTTSHVEIIPAQSLFSAYISVLKVCFHQILKNEIIPKVYFLKTFLFIVRFVYFNCTFFSAFESKVKILSFTFI